MISAPLPDDEHDRLDTLRRLAVLDSDPEPLFDAITDALATSFKAPIALISFVDAERQWFKSHYGLEARETPREWAFCAHAILDSPVLVVPNARADARFFDNPLVTAGPLIAAYLGAPISVEGQKLGTVCVIDREPRPWSRDEVGRLEKAARVVEAALVLRRGAATADNLARDVLRLSASEARWRAVTSVMSEGIVIQDRDGSIVDANPAAARILGLTPDQLMGRSSLDPQWRAVRPDGQSFPGEEHPAMVAIRTGQTLERVPMGVELPTGERRWIAINASPAEWTDDGGVKRVVATFSDVTAETLAAAEIAESKVQLGAALERAEAASAAKSAFLANMSHEVRTPLNGVMGIVASLLRTPLNPDQRAMAELIRSSGEVLERVVGDVLDLSKIEADALTLEFAPFDLRREIEMAAELLRVRAEEKGLDFIVLFDGDSLDGVRFEGDAHRLRQVVSNLASNAVKFTEKGHVEIRTRVLMNPDGVARVRIEVEDSGIGFDPAQAERLFRPFAQADDSITRRFGGSGLGLSISRAIIERMGGALTAASTPGRGSLFAVELPLLVTEEAAACAEQPTEEPRAPEGLRILIAEDHPTNQQVLRLMLEPFGSDLTIVDDGAQAVEAFQRARFDLVLMDMQMPVMDGLTAVRTIRDLEPRLGVARTPIAMLTANALEEHRREAGRAGADSFISKPVTPAALFGTISRLARREEDSGLLDLKVAS